MSTHRTPSPFARRVAAVVSASALLGGLVAIASSAPATAVAGACLPDDVRAVATVSSRPGGTTATLVITSREYPRCQWAVPTGYQFASASGTAIGPVVYPVPHASPTRWVAVNFGFRVVARVTTMSGVNCSTQSADLLRVSVPGQVSPLSVALRTPIAVCVGDTTAWTSVTESRPAVPACDAAQLALSIGPPNGAAGTVYYPLRVRNSAGTACSLSGIPTVRALRTTSGATVGPPARRLSVFGYGSTIGLTPGASASAALGASDVGNWPRSTCAPATARALSVRVSGTRLVVPKVLRVCTRLASLNVRAWVPGLTGHP